MGTQQILHYSHGLLAQTVRSRIVGEGFWVGLGQALTAAGLVVGIRLQTEYISPAVFGAASLWVGIASLIVGMVCSPYAQGALRFLPEAVNTSQLHGFRWEIWRMVFRKVIPLALLIVIGGGSWMLFWGGSTLTMLMLGGMVIAESARTIEMAFCNGLRQQRSYAAWAVAEAWGRPLAAVASVHSFGPHTWAVLTGYLASSGVNLLLFGGMPLIRTCQAIRRGESLPSAALDDVARYCRPLVPMGLVGWISSLSDRYLIAGILGMHQAGVYTAIYGLITRPFLMVQSTLELTLRPVYFKAVTEGDRHGEWRLYRRWLALNALAGLTLFLVFGCASDLIVENLLGESYRSGAVLIPYLATGHVLLITAYNLNSYLYAHQHTREIFLITALTAVVSLGAVALFASLRGLTGAAAASIAYFGFQAAVLGGFILAKERRISTL